MQDDLQTLAGRDGVSVHTGFPNQTLVRISGHNWTDQGIFDGDLALVDRALQAGASDLLIAWRGGSTVILRQTQLDPEDRPWGVITAVTHYYRP
jgi:hypothetical protein